VDRCEIPARQNGGATVRKADEAQELAVERGPRPRRGRVHEPDGRLCVERQEGDGPAHIPVDGGPGEGGPEDVWFESQEVPRASSTEAFAGLPAPGTGGLHARTSRGGVNKRSPAFITRANSRSGGGKTDVRIRRATRKDYEAIWKATVQTVWDDVPPDERERVDRTTFESHFRPRAQEIMKSPENDVHVAEDGAGRFLGYTIVGPATSMLSPVPFGFVYDVWVSPEARRQGVATALLGHAIAWCRRQGLMSLKLEVGARNGAARGFYASAGFEEERISLGKPL